MAIEYVAASNQYSYASNANVVTAAPLTIAAWCYCPNSTGVYVKVGLYTNPSNDGFYLWASNADCRAYAHSVATNTYASKTHSHTNTWFLAVAWFGSSTSRYAGVDDSWSTQDTTSVTPTITSHITLGSCRAYGSFNWGEGRLAEVGIWNVALDTPALTSLAKGVCPRMIQPASLKHYWQCSGNNDPELEWINNFNVYRSASPTKAAHCRAYYPSSPWNLGVPAAAAPATGATRLVPGIIVGGNLVGGALIR